MLGSQLEPETSLHVSNYCIELLPTVCVCTSLYNVTCAWKYVHSYSYSSNDNHYELDSNFHVVTFLFNGTVVTQPYLLYHDEISMSATVASGNFTCVVESGTPVWRDVSAAVVGASSPLQPTTSGLMSRLSRTGDPVPNGMWNCRDEVVNANGYVGIYDRGEGKLTYTFSRMLV